MSVPAYATVIARLPEASILLSSRLEIVFANSRAEALFGRPSRELSGLPLSDFTVQPAEAVTDLVRIWSRSAAATPASLTLSSPGADALRLRCDGALLQPSHGEEPGMLMVRLVPVAHANKGFLALNLRIEELKAENLRRRRAEAELQAQTEFLKVTLSSIGDAVITTDPEGRVTFINPVGAALTGWTDEEARGRLLPEIFAIVNETTRVQVENPVDKVLRHGTVVGLANHTTLIARDGTEHAIDDSAAPIRDDRGAIIGVVLVFHDVTERRHLELQRDATERRKDEFLAMLGHELRNPLSALMNSVRLIRESHRGAGTGESALEFGELVERMERQGRHLIRLVDDLLDTARITNGKITLQKSIVSLQTVLSNSIDMCRAELSTGRIELELDMPTEPIRVLADGSRLTQIFANLLANAIKYSYTGGHVRMVVRAQSDSVTVTVSDSGIGMTPDLLESVFELFTQADKSLARSSGGLGIGLTVARAIAEMHGGSITAHSAGLRQGSTFVVSLPLSCASGPGDAQPETGDEVSAKKAPRRVLIVDDNEDAATSLALLLSLSSHEVHTAGNGQHALSAAADFGPDVVLLDLGLPDIDGYEVARRLRQSPVSRAALIIAVTGYGADRDRQQTRDAGFDHHLTKPIDVDALEQLIASHAEAD